MINMSHIPALVELKEKWETFMFCACAAENRNSKGTISRIRAVKKINDLIFRI
jgi:hypothetical protein